MAITAQGCVTAPDSVEVSITLTMTVGEWRLLVSDLPSRYPNWKIANIIADILSPVTSKVTQKYDSEAAA